VTAFIDGHRGRFGVEPICRTLDVSASAYYHRATGARSERLVDDERLLELIKTTHTANYYAYGYRRTWKALLRAGEDIGRDRVKRLMRQDGIQGAKRRGKPWRTKTPDPDARRSPDLVNRDFTADRPDALWVADFSYVGCYEAMVFFSFVIDVFSRRIVGWRFASHMRTVLVLDALRMARSPAAKPAPISSTTAMPARRPNSSGLATVDCGDGLYGSDGAGWADVRQSGAAVGPEAGPEGGPQRR
jgi:putative transposase